jgi:phosphoglycolate phosphatase-like HAD superfamily hydrolase
MGTIVFDWDGTLVDIDEREFVCINEALVSIGSPMLSKQDYINGYYLNPYENPGARLLLRRILTDPKMASQAIAAYSKKFSETILLTRLKEGAHSLPRTLREKGVPLAVATLRRSRGIVEQEMQHLSIKDLVDVLVTLEDMKPERQTQRIFSIVAEVRAEEFAKALFLLKKAPSEAMIVGDAWWDIRAAKKIHATSVWVKTCFGTYNDFSKEQPDITIDDLRELPKHIKN